MKSFSTTKEVGDYLREKKVGEKCILTGGSAKKRNVMLSLMRSGLRATVTGESGARIVELTSAFSAELKKQRQAVQSKYLALDLQGVGQHYPDGLAVGGSTTVKASNGKALRAWVTKRYGPWTCTIQKLENSGDWRITRVSAESDPTKFNQQRGLGSR